MTHPLLDSIVGDRRLRIVASERTDGDVHPVHVPEVDLRNRQMAISGRPWTLLDQVHGADVVDLDAGIGSGEPEQHSMAVGDVATTTRPGTHVAVWAADCAPVVLACDDGTLVGAHGGWRGLAAGVVDVAVAEATRRGGTVVAAVLGPVIHPCCYEFGVAEMAMIPDGVSGVTRSGRLALDVPATVAASLARHGVRLDVSGPCTGCDFRWFSHRVRADAERHAVVAWWESTA